MFRTELSGLRLRFFLRVVLPGILAFFLFAGLIIGFLIPGFEKSMIEKKCEMISELTQSAYSLIEYYHQQETSGILTQEKAQNQAVDVIRRMRYGSELKDYFWITDQKPIMIMHPYRPDLEGNDLRTFYDPHGKALFVEFVKTTNKSGSGFVDYMWQWKDDSLRIVPKLSYVKLFSPWKWIIGTGVYIEDVKTEIKRLEQEAILISGIIGLFIMVLLIFLTRQSFRIEVQRQKAERELRESRERYKALAEVSSDGVLIISSKGLHANKTLLGWLDYNEVDFQAITLDSLLLDKNLKPVHIDFKIHNLDVFSGLTELFFRKRDHGLFRVHSEFSNILIGDEQAIMVVSKSFQVISGINQVGFSAPLANLSNSGFIKTTTGRRPRIIYASKSFFRILGLSDQFELDRLMIDSIFIDKNDRRLLFLELSNESMVTERLIQIRRFDSSIIQCIISANLVHNETGESYCECVIDLISTNWSDAFIMGIAGKGFAGNLILDSPVSEFVEQLITCRLNTEIDLIKRLFIENSVESIVVVTPDNTPVGIISRQMLGIYNSSNGFHKSEAYQIMNSPLDNINETDCISDVLPLLASSHTGYLLVRNDSGMAIGTFGNNQFVKAMTIMPKMIITRINDSYSVAGLIKCFDSAQELAYGLIDGNQDPQMTVQFLAMITDSISKRVLELATLEMGEPPVLFSFIQLGSVGRGEQTLLTDQDNAIIFRDVEPQQHERVRNYFIELGKLVNKMLDEVGYSLCKGNIMAGNPNWCQPLSKWKQYFSNWIKSPGPDEILEISIFFDFRHIYGDAEIAEELRGFIKQDLVTSDIFYHHMASSFKPFAPKHFYKPLSIVNVKRLMIPVVGIIRLYALKHDIKGTGSIEKLIEMYQKNLMSRAEMVEIMQAIKTLTAIRLNWQREQIAKKMLPDNDVDLRMMSTQYVQNTEQAVKIIDGLMLKAANEFHTNPED